MLGDFCVFCDVGGLLLLLLGELAPPPLLFDESLNGSFCMIPDLDSFSPPASFMGKEVSPVLSFRVSELVESLDFDSEEASFMGRLDLSEQPASFSGSCDFIDSEGDSVILVIFCSLVALRR